ncbi:unnamed protein product, partial [Dibothriocephalus latus]
MQANVDSNNDITDNGNAQDIKGSTNGTTPPGPGGNGNHTDNQNGQGSCGSISGSTPSRLRCYGNATANQRLDVPPMAQRKLIPKAVATMSTTTRIGREMTIQPMNKRHQVPLATATTPTTKMDREVAVPSVIQHRHVSDAA